MAAVACAVFLSGCFVVSVNPLFRDQDLTFEPALLGTWTTPCNEGNEPGRPCSLVFSSADHKTYTVEYTDENGVTVGFDGYLGQLGQHLYLDVVPHSSELKGVPLAARDHALLLHSFWKLGLKPAELTLTALRSDEALRRALRRAGMPTGSTRTASHWERDYDLLLGSTPELQHFLRTYGAKPEAWDPKPLVWRKQ